MHRPWITEPGHWLQYDFGHGPVIDGFLRGRTRPATQAIVAVIDEQKDRTDGGRRWGVESNCVVLTQHDVKIAPSDYYETRGRGPSAREAATAAWALWFNTERTHGSIDDHTPVKLERLDFALTEPLKRAG